MQEHIQLEVSLEIIMARIANEIFKLSSVSSGKEKIKIQNELEALIKLQEKAYMGDRNSILSILDRSFLNYDD